MEGCTLWGGVGITTTLTICNTLPMSLEKHKGLIFQNYFDYRSIAVEDYIYIYIYTHIYTYMGTCTCKHAFIYIHTQIYEK